MSETKDIELEVGKADADHQMVRAIYAQQAGRYTVYATADRIKVRFANDPRRQLLFRRRLVAISKLRSQIAGLQSTLSVPTRRQRFWYWLRRKSMPANGGPLAHWRDPTAFAIVDALEGHGEAANETLAYVHSQLLAVRLARARHNYLRWGIVTVCTVMVVTGATSTMASGLLHCAPIIQNLALSVAIGALGAFFSIAQSISSRSIRTDGQGAVDVTTRILVGCISAFVLEALLDSKLLSLQIGTEPLVVLTKMCGSTDLTSWPVTIVAAFLAGFAEKLIPDLMKRYVDHTSGADPAVSPLANGRRGSAMASAAANNASVIGTGPMPDDPEGVDSQPPTPPGPTATPVEEVTSPETQGSPELDDPHAASLSAEADSIEATAADVDDAATANPDTDSMGTGGTG